MHLLFAFLLLAGASSHDLFMSICEIEKTNDNQLEVRFYLFHDDLEMAIHQNPGAKEIDPEEAQKYISEKTELTLNGKPAQLRFHALDYHQGQVRLTYQMDISPNQKIEKVELKNRLLLEFFPTQVNMVYFIKNDGERLVKMLDASKTEAEFNGLNG